MNKIETKISEVRTEQTKIQMKDRLTDKDYDRIRELEKEEERLKSKRQGGYYIVQSENSFAPYLTNDPTFCWCSDKTYFSTKKEAQEAIDKAEIRDKSQLKIVKEVLK
jgi:hypothetical protein